MVLAIAYSVAEHVNWLVSTHLNMLDTTQLGFKINDRMSIAGIGPSGHLERSLYKSAKNRTVKSIDSLAL